MDWETLCCPHRHCRGYGKPFSPGSLVKNGPRRGPPRAWCTVCEARGVLRDGTASDGLEAGPVVFATAGRALAAGTARRATAPIVPVAQETVCPWLQRVACHCRTIRLSFWHALHVRAGQRDALGGACLPKKRICPAPRSLAPPRGKPGCGAPVPPPGAGSWPA